MPISDLSIVKTASDLAPAYGDDITFTLTVTNAGPNNDTGVTVTDIVPAGYTVVSRDASSGSWVGSVWTIGALNNGITRTAHIIATVLPTGPYANTSTVTGVNTDPNPSNNTSTSTPVPTCPIITVLPVTLPSWVIGSSYNQSISATGGAFPYVFTVSYGSLPNGWSLDSTTGIITPGTNFTGSASFAITATDDNGCQQSAEYSFDVVRNISPPLTDQQKLERSLKIYNCCASKKGAEYITKLKSGKECPELLQDAEIMVGLIDSLIGFKLEGAVISGDQATATIDLDLGGLQTIQLTIGTTTYPLYTFSDSSDSEEIHVSEFADFINYLYSASFPYTASVIGTDLIISGINYDADNDIEGSLSIHQQSQAYHVFPLGTNEYSISITIGTSVYPTYIFADRYDTGEVHATEFTAYINSLYDITLYPYTAAADGSDVRVEGLDYSADNATAGTISISFPPFSSFANFELEGGVDPTDSEIDFTLDGGTSTLQGENCITNNDSQSIINKLSDLCSTPCKNIMNFQN